MKWLIGYLEGLGIALDISLCALLGGPGGTTVSMWAAVDEQKKEHWACLMCRFLSWLVQKQHCQDQLKNIPMSVKQYLRAIAGLLALSFLLFSLAHFALALIRGL